MSPINAFLKKITQPLINKAMPVYQCCNHCFSENGTLMHDRAMLDMHTVSCNEPNCSQNPESF
jgi:hypothetical protein